MIARLKAWWKARGERRCAAGDHAWGPDRTAAQMFPERSAFEHLSNLTGYWSFARCTRCGALGRRLSS